ncbi:hypothetical protein [Metabacillus arenae]|uniref:Uncharacterized protein n=1 Tax=Metabacillus arenae TaxID=2771434 RepID=A0A926RZJ7_9BACI|nr:hypothetical protein [Metabacillus arenae]MBD1382880.1 hypothetical protein [Metabacillus arenae]
MITTVFDVGFIDFSFAVGLFGVVVIHFFNSEGGFSSKHLDMKVQGETGIRLQHHEGKKFSPSIAFYTAILYTIAAIIALFITYKEYF